MDLQTQSHGTVELVTLPQRLVMANAQELRTAIRALVERGRTRLILDLHGVEFVDSSGLSVLVSTLKAVRPRQGVVVLLSPTDGVRSLIELTRLHQIFEIYEDREAAIGELGEEEVADR
jgi:anti-sigma B factor antagonist